MRIDPSVLITGTIGVAHSELSTLEMMPSSSRRSSSALTFSWNECGILRALQKTGLASSLKNRRAVIPFKTPTPSRKTSGYLAFNNETQLSVVILLLGSEGLLRKDGVVLEQERTSAGETLLSLVSTST